MTRGGRFDLLCIPVLCLTAAPLPLLLLPLLTLFLLASAAGLFWLAEYTDSMALHGLGWVAVGAAYFARRAPPMRL